jgi:hypothetical protein
MTAYILGGLSAFAQRGWQDIDTIGFHNTQVITKDGFTLVFINKDSLFDKATGEKMKAAFFKVYPQQVKRFNPAAPRTVMLVIDPSYEGVAATSGDVVRFDASYVHKFPNDIDAVTHELMHVVQAYPDNGSGPGWITEGIADYGRYKYGVDNVAAGWSLPPYSTSHRYTGSYQITARFFVWLEKKVDPKVVDKIDRLMRSGRYNDGVWKKLYGKTIDELWKEYDAGLGM